jgi:2-polyprenyl-3-methyl-5-hydroxy-6-metoxy-1,4-benzoquinol methylase
MDKLSQEQESIYTSGEYLINAPLWHVEDSVWKAKQVLKIITKNDLHPDSIGEIGCGAGEILNQLLMQMPAHVRFTGYEIAPDAFKLCQQRVKERLVFKLADMLDENICFDLVMALDVVEHIEDYFGFLRKLREKGKYKLFHIPLEMSILKLMLSSYLIKHRKQFGHIQYFNKETFLATLEDTGYKVIDYFYTASTFEVPAKIFEHHLARLPRKILFMLNKGFAAKTLGGCSLMVLAQ